jgi:predicted amidohydrolase
MGERRAILLVGQLAPAVNDPITNGHAVAEVLHDHQGIDLAVFPDLFLNGNSPAFLRENAITLDSLVVRRIREAARRANTAVIVGLAERSFGLPSDTVLCVDGSGAVAGVYRTVHLSGAARRHLGPGSSFAVATMGALRVAPLTDGDLAHAAAARSVARAGIDLLVTLAATEEGDAGEQSVLVRARAIENRVPHAYVNRVGAESRRRYAGESTVLDAAGLTLATLAPGRAEVRVVEVPIGVKVEPDHPSLARDDVAVLAVTGGGPATGPEGSAGTPAEPAGAPGDPRIVRSAG